MEQSSPTSASPPTLHYGRADPGEGRRGVIETACFVLGVANVVTLLVCWGGFLLLLGTGERRFGWAKDAVWVPWLVVGPTAMVALLALGPGRPKRVVRLAAWAERLNAACLATIPISLLVAILAVGVRR